MDRLDPDDLTLLIDVSSQQPVYPELEFDGGYSEWLVTLVGMGFDSDATSERAVTLGSTLAVLCRDARYNGMFWDRLDEASQDMETIGSALANENAAADQALFDRATPDGDILIFDRVFIEHRARGARLSHVLVDAAARAISPNAVLALLPMPLGHQDLVSIKRMQRHWERGGFSHYRDGVYVKRPQSELDDL